MKLKAEFRKRLEKAEEAIAFVLWVDEQNKAEYRKDLMPRLWSLYSYMWMKTYKDMIKK